MKVEIDIDELCRLKEVERMFIYGAGDDASFHDMPQYQRVIRTKQAEIDSLAKERDWWRTQAYKLAVIIADIKVETDKLEHGQLYSEAKKLGYE